MPKGHSLSIYACFLAKKRTSLYISRGKRRSLLYIQHGAHNDLSFPLDYNLFLGKLDEKLAQGLQFLYANPQMFCVQCRIPFVFRYLYRYSQLYLPDEECARHTTRVGDNKTVQFTTQEVRRSASHWFILVNIPDAEKPIEDSLKGVSRNWATQTWP